MLVATLLASFLSMQTADIVTTCQGLSRGGYQETNPLAPASCVGAATATAAVDVAGGVVMRKWMKNRAVRVVMLSTLTGIEGAVVAHNLHELRRK